MAARGANLCWNALRGRLGLRCGSAGVTVTSAGWIVRFRTARMARAAPYRCAYADNVVAGPCGGIRTNLLGMIAWLRCLLDSGAPLCAEQAFHALLVPNVPTESEGGHELLCSYAMGWRTSAYRGKRLVYHGGAIAGFQSHVAFFPEENKGIVVLLNTSSTTGRRFYATCCWTNCAVLCRNLLRPS